MANFVQSTNSSGTTLLQRQRQTINEIFRSGGKQWAKMVLVCVCMVLASTLMKNTCDGISLRSIFRLSIVALQHFSLSSLQTQHFSNDAFHVFDCKNVVGGGRWIVNGKTDELSKNNWPLYRNFILLRIGNNHPFDVEEIAGWISENWKWRSRKRNRDLWNRATVLLL